MRTRKTLFACLEGALSVLEKGELDHIPSTLVLVAALNEEIGIGLTLQEIKSYLPDSTIVVVDGCSIDKTVHTAKDQGAEVLFQEGIGKGNAISWGLQNIKDYFDFVVFTDADYTYPARYIPKMIQILKENPRIGMVCGNRFNSKFHLKDMRDLFYFGNRLISLVHKLANGINLRDPLTGLRVLRGNILKNWQPKSLGFDVEVELNNYVENQGYKIAEIEIPYRARLGEKKLKVKHGLEILKRILLEAGYSVENMRSY